MSRGSARRGPSRELQLKSLVLAVAVLIALLTLAVLPASRAWLQGLEVIATVWRFNARGKVSLDSRVKVVGITESMINGLSSHGEPYPFPRDVHAIALRRLADAGARVVVVDILFADDSFEEAEDQALAEALVYCRELGCSVILASGLEMQELPGVAGLSATWVELASLIQAVEPLQGLANTEQKLTYKLTERVSTVHDGKALLSMPVMAWLEADLAADHQRLQGRYSINYSSPPQWQADLTYSIDGSLLPEIAGFDDRWAELKLLREGRNWNELNPAQLAELEQAYRLEGDEARAASEVFEGAFVFYGSRTALDNDYFNTPYGMMFGVDTLAQAFDTLLRDRMIKAVGWLPTLALMVILAVLAWWLALRRPILLSAVAGLCVLAFVIVFNLGLFSLARLELPLVLSGAAFALPFIACIVFSGVAEEGQRKRQYATFSPYLSDELVQELLANPELADLGGSKHEGVVMFNDIRAYSTITEHLDAQRIVIMLNKYLGAMADEIRTSGGFLDKFMGDGLLAFFGGPVPLDNPVCCALDCSIAMVRVLHERVNPQLEAEGFEPLRIGIGLHLGEIVMGNIGSAERKNFTVIGDAVNVAARVEGQTKEYGWAILVTREVVDAAGEGYTFRRVGEQIVKGRRQPVELYCLVDPSNEDCFRLSG